MGTRQADGGAQPSRVASTPAIPDLFAGSVVALMTIAYSLSFAALIFSGPLEAARGYGMVAALIGAGLCCLTTPYLSSIRASVAGPDGPTAAVLATIAASVAAHPSMSLAMGDPRNAAAIIGAVMAMAAGLSAAVLLAMGALRLGVLMRFIPYPVVTGFIAASGVYMILGGIAVATGRPVSWSALENLFVADVWPLWATAAAAATAIAVARKASGAPTAIPFATLALLVATPAVVASSYGSLDAARDAGWLIQAGVASPGFAHWSGADWSAADRAALAEVAPEMLVAAFLTATVILLNTVAYEVVRRAPADVDAELRAAGAANLIVAASGGLMGNLSLNRTILNLSAGARSKVSVLICGALCMLAAFVGSDLLRLISPPILAGLLCFAGATIIAVRLGPTLRASGPQDAALALSIAALILIFGYLAGAALGLLAACALFSLNYSRTPFVQRDVTRSAYSSLVERPREDTRLLEREGGRIRILSLQGFIFFGAASQLVERLKPSLVAPEGGGGGGRWLLLDFGRVTAVDSSARFAFARLTQLAEAEGVELILCAMTGKVQGALQDAGARIFETRDQAVEACEDALLRGARATAPAATGDDQTALRAWLGGRLGERAHVDDLISHLARRRVAAGETICRQGDPADSLFFVLSGRISISIERPDAPPVRLRSMLGRTLVGEMGFFNREMRSADVRADEESVLYELTRDAHDRMLSHAPETANALALFVVRTLSARLAYSNRVIDDLQR